MGIARDEVRRLAEAGAQLVEVLPRAEFDDEHLPGAISLPLKSLTAGTSAVLDRSRPVIVYCWDGLICEAPSSVKAMLPALRVRWLVLPLLPGRRWSSGRTTRGQGGAPRRTNDLDAGTAAPDNCAARKRGTRMRSGHWDAPPVGG
jgi:Rhodanese-like domain